MNHSKFWELKQSAELSEELSLYIYSDVQGDYFDWADWKMKESETSAEYFRQQLEAHPNAKEIKIYINSLGGSVMEGVAIYNQLRRHPAHKTVYVDGFACSVASVIAMAGDTVIMPRNTVMMIHNAWTYARGNAEELRKIADDLDVLNAASRQAYLRKAGDKLTEDALIGMLDAETYLTAMDCIEYGLADEYANDEVSIETAKQMLAQAKQDGLQQYKNRLERVCAIASAPPEEKNSQPENRAMRIITSYFK